MQNAPSQQLSIFRDVFMVYQFMNLFIVYLCVMCITMCIYELW